MIQPPFLNNNNNETKQQQQSTKKAIRIDFILSHWLVAWFILYYIGDITYSPKFALIVAYAINLVQWTYFIYKGSTKYNIIKYFVLVSMAKIIPLLLIWNMDEIVLPRDIYLTLGVIILYLVWVVGINQYNPIHDYEDLNRAYLAPFPSPGDRRTFNSRMYDMIFGYR